MCTSVYRPRFPEHRRAVTRDPAAWRCELDENPHDVHELGALRWTDAPALPMKRVQKKPDGQSNRKARTADPQKAHERPAVPTIPPHPPTMLEGAEVAPAAELGAPPDELAELVALGAVAARYAVDSVPENTRRTYRSQWNTFTAWAEAYRLPFLPADAETVALYLAHLGKSGRKVSTIEVALAAIGQAHRLAGHVSPRQDPIVQTVLRGIRRRHRTMPDQKAPLLDDQLVGILGALPDTNAGRRDRALLLTGWLGALRRSETAALDVADARFVPRGVLLTVKQRKRDQEGKGTTIALPRGIGPVDPVEALRRWIGERTEGPLFLAVDQWDHILSHRLSGQAIGELVQRHTGGRKKKKKRAEPAAASTAPAEVAAPRHAFGGHSLRAGFVTSAACKGVGEHWIAEQTGHKSTETLRGYIRQADPFSHNAGAGLLVAPPAPAPPSSAAEAPRPIPATREFLEGQPNWTTPNPKQQPLFSDDPASQEGKA